jgi:hypothetical protein
VPELFFLSQTSNQAISSLILIPNYLSVKSWLIFMSSTAPFSIPNTLCDNPTFKLLFVPFDLHLSKSQTNLSDFVHYLSMYVFTHISYTYDYVTKTCSPLMSFQCACVLACDSPPAWHFSRETCPGSKSFLFIYLSTALLLLLIFSISRAACQ